VKFIKPAPASLAIAGLALSLVLAPESGAAEVASTPPGYIVPIAAGSAEDPAMRPAMPSGLSFDDASNIALPLTHFRGAVLLINFWATWCVPCVKEMTFIDRLQGDLKGQPLVVLAVSEDRGGVSVAKAFLERQKLTFLRPFADPGGAAANALQVDGIPTSFIVDKKGRLVQRLEGPYEWDDPPIVNRFRALLTEAP
jgi:thiol-disulfide isomerase/thioredoxin